MWEVRSNSAASGAAEVTARGLVWQRLQTRRGARSPTAAPLPWLHPSRRSLLPMGHGCKAASTGSGKLQAVTSRALVAERGLQGRVRRTVAAAYQRPPSGGSFRKRGRCRALAPQGLMRDVTPRLELVFPGTALLAVLPLHRAIPEEPRRHGGQTTEIGVHDDDVAPNFYPAVSSFWRLDLPCRACWAAGADAEPFMLRSV